MICLRYGLSNSAMVGVTCTGSCDEVFFFRGFRINSRLVVAFSKRLSMYTLLVVVEET